MKRLFGIALVVGCLTSEVSSAATFPGLSYERPSLFWSFATRPDGSTRFWDPDIVLKVNSNLVCVNYGALDEKGQKRNIGNLPPALLAKTLVNAKPELAECHSHGIKVIGYEDTIQFLPSTFKSEGIDPETLYALDIDGNKVPCNTWLAGNYVSCINNPKWLDLQKQVTLVTADAGFDALQFDLYPYAVAPGYHCHCQYCESEWKSYTQVRFGAPLALPGTSLDRTDPLHRAYVEWRMLRMASFLKTMEAHVRKSHPDFVVLQNNCVDGTDYPYLALTNAIAYPSTELWHVTLGDESSLHMYRLAEALNGGKALAVINSFSQVDPMYRYRAAISESYAGGSAIHVGAGALEKVSRQYLKFVEDQQDWFIDSRSDASVGILFSWRDLVFLQNNDLSTTHVIPWKENSFRRAAALLARQGVPYDFVVIENGLNAAQLVRYKVLVAPEIDLLDDADAGILKEYVSSGGHLLCIGNVGASKSVGNDYVTRSKALLADWTGKEAGHSYWGTSLGAGAIAYVPAAITGDSEKTMTATADFKQGSQYTGCGSQLKIKCRATVEATIRAKESQKFIHLVRLGPTDGAGDVSMSIDYTLPPNAQVSSVEAASTDSSSQLGMTWSLTSPGMLHMDLKRLDQYVVIHVTLR
jgi:Beta-galactosidase trimerisation domain